MFRHRLYQWLLALLAVGLIAAAGTFQGPIDDLRREMDRERGEDVTEAFAELRLWQAMPGFLRALAINYLWIHSETQKSKGQYYDAEYTSQQICRLQPRFPAVWANRAWNLAYNISVKQHTAADRWACVQQGIHLLRNEGLKYNPKSLPLYRELAWIYQHKLGQLMDDMHHAYKEYHAGEFHRILGAPPRRGFEDYMARYRRWLQPIVDAPDEVEVLLADADVAAMVGDVEALKVELGLPLLDVYNTWSADPLVRQLRQPIPEADTERKTQLQHLMTDPALAAPRKAIVAFSRRKVLREDYRMKPSWMLHLAEHYGPIDWRLVWTHSLYWSTYGLNHIKGLDVTDVDSINTGRHIIESLKNLAAFGRLTLWYNAEDPRRPRCSLHADWRYIDVCHEAYLRLGEFYTKGEAADDETLRAYRAGHENFLRAAVRALYFAGRIDEANRHLDYLRRVYGRGVNPLYKLNLEQFVWHLLDNEGLRQLSTVQVLVSQMIDQAFLNLAAGNDEAFQFQVQRAHYFWRSWNELVGHDTRKELDRQFNNILSQGVVVALETTTDPEAAMGIWDQMPDGLQLALYDLLQARFRHICERQGIDFDKAFPEPSGLEEFRAAQEARQRRYVTPGSESGTPWRAKNPDPKTAE
ncbi:MAG: hypothetical protein ACOC95_03170 [Planctomycetota bacterium]